MPKAGHYKKRVEICEVLKKQQDDQTPSARIQQKVVTTCLAQGSISRREAKHLQRVARNLAARCDLVNNMKGCINMDIVDIWAVKIAEAAAPDEVVLASVTVQAYIAGGAERADLFRQNQRGTPGGFDFGPFQVVLPYLLQGLQIATSPIITSVFSSVLSELFLEFVKKKLKEGKEPSQERGTRTEPVAR
jgi:hypothetical protein